MHLGWGIPRYPHRLLENSPAKRDFRVLVDEKLDMNWQCVDSPRKQLYLGLHQKQHGQ